MTINTVVEEDILVQSSYTFVNMSVEKFSRCIIGEFEICIRYVSGVSSRNIDIKFWS